MPDPPTFDHLKPAHVQIGATNLNQFGAIAKWTAFYPSVGTRISQTGGGQTMSAIKRRFPSIPTQPFNVTLYPTSGGAQVTVEDGYVVEREEGTAGGDCINYYSPSNNRDSSGALSYFTIDTSTTQAVCVQVKVYESGQMSMDPSDCKIVVTHSSVTSTHFMPLAPHSDNTTGTTGTYYYKLAEFAPPVSGTGAPVMSKMMAGQNIDHWQDLPLIDNYEDSTTGTGDGSLGIAGFFSQYSGDDNTYYFKNLHDAVGTGGQIHVRSVPTDGSTVTIPYVEVRGNKVDGDVRLGFNRSQSTGNFTQYWQDGLVTVPSGDQTFNIGIGDDFNVFLDDVTFTISSEHIYDTHGVLVGDLHIAQTTSSKQLWVRQGHLFLSDPGFGTSTQDIHIVRSVKWWDARTIGSGPDTEGDHNFIIPDGPPGP